MTPGDGVIYLAVGAFVIVLVAVMAVGMQWVRRGK